MFISRKELRALKRAALYPVRDEIGMVQYVPIRDVIAALADAVKVDIRWQSEVDGRVTVVRRK